IFLGAAGLLATAVIAALSPALAGGDGDLAKLIILASLGVTPALILAGLRALALGVQRWWLVTMEKIVGSGLRAIAIGGLWVAGSLD
ncbi:hypothetical protein ACC848_41445, partial [Rhizobium johnstonii]